MSDGSSSAIRERGAWIGLILAGLSLIEVALVLARGGGYFVVVPHLAIVLPLAVVGAVSALAALGVGERPDAIAWLGVVALAGFGWNVCTYSIKFGRAAWGVLIPFAHPHGIDFRDGLYDPARAFTTVHSGWPPLTLYLGRPFTLLGFSTAYGVQIGILVVLAVAATVLSVKLALRAVGDDAAKAAVRSGAPGAPGHDATAPPAAPGAGIDARLLGLIMGLWLLTSYGFMYGIERGNIDLYALFFSLLCVWSVVRGARSAWAPAAFLAVAVGLKLYPAILVVVLLWRYRWRAVLPLALTTLVVFLVAGPANLVHSFSTLQALSTSKTAEWWGQDSATAMAHVLHGHTTWAPSWVWYPLIGVPLALWATTLIVLARRGWSERGAVLASAACVPLMAIVPPVSNDYKLVMCVFPLAVLAAAVASLRREPPVAWIVTFGALSFAMIFLARSTILVGPSLQGSKYTLLVLVQVLLLAVVTWPRAACSDGAPAPSRSRPAADGVSAASPAP